MIAIWDSSLSVGDGILDAEHRLVVDLLNELDVALAVGAPFAVVEMALDALGRAVARHFARSAEPHPPGEHDRILGRVRQLQQAWGLGQRQRLDHRALLELGRRWIAHIGRHEPPPGPAPLFRRPQVRFAASA
ncbi:bacteriohemerythrin [Phaeospirillum tilakii]|uniref:Bacteriohemerythrin n=1 Tax=Phaeospirillum tilakii TaxID=741673 RepID=A0ABW5C8U5_9PROT